MILLEQINKCIADAKEIRDNNPLISDVWFRIKDADIKEMEYYSKEWEQDLKENGNKLLLCVPKKITLNATIFVHSKPVKRNTTVTYEEISVVT